MTGAVVWLVLWFVFMFVGVVVGQLFGFLMTFASMVEGNRKRLWITIPVGLAGFAFAFFALIQVILQIIDIISRITA